MTITQAIMLLGIVAAATVAFIVGYLQRKQMRQVELYRQDPTVGLVPPPSPLTKFVKSKWDSALGIGMPVLSLVIEFSGHAPITRLSVALISLNVAFLLVNFVMYIVFRLFDKTMALITEINADNARRLAMQEQTLARLDTITAQLSGRADSA